MSFLPDTFYEGVHIVFDTLFVAGLRERGTAVCFFIVVFFIVNSW